MRDGYATNSRYITYTFIFRRLRECTLNLGVKELKQTQNSRSALNRAMRLFDQEAFQFFGNKRERSFKPIARISQIGERKNRPLVMYARLYLVALIVVSKLQELYSSLWTQAWNPNRNPNSPPQLARTKFVPRSRSTPRTERSGPA